MQEREVGSDYEVVSQDGTCRVTAFAANDGEGRRVWLLSFAQRAEGDPQWVASGLVAGRRLPEFADRDAARQAARTMVWVWEQGYQDGVEGTYRTVEWSRR